MGRVDGPLGWRCVAVTSFPSPDLPDIAFGNASHRKHRRLILKPIIVPMYYFLLCTKLWGISARMHSNGAGCQEMSPPPYLNDNSVLSAAPLQIQIALDLRAISILLKLIYSLSIGQELEWGANPRRVL
jgi:hypothetical protein